MLMRHSSLHFADLKHLKQHALNDALQTSLSDLIWPIASDCGELEGLQSGCSLHFDFVVTMFLWFFAYGADHRIGAVDVGALSCNASSYTLQGWTD